MKINKKVKRLSLFSFLSFLLFYPLSLRADYTILLENGRRITVTSYWEENGMVKFQALQGEMGLGREQIRSIEDARDAKMRGFVLADMEKGWAKEEARRAKALAVKDKAGSPVGVEKEKTTFRRTEKLLKSEKEKDYQEMYESLTNKIKVRTDLKWLITRGTATPNPVLLETLVAINGRINDLRSRIKDAEIDLSRRARGVVTLITNSSFSGQPWETVMLTPQGVVTPGSVDAQSFNVPRIARRLPSYTRSEAELSNLRRHLEELYDERNRLIEEFKKQELFSGSLPYEAFP